MRIILIAFLVLSIDAYSQIHLYNSSLTDTTQSIVYRGFDNQIMVTGDLDSVLLLISSDGDTLEYFDNSFHFKRPKRGFDTILVFKANRKIGEQVFKSELLKPPSVFLGNIRDSIIKKDQLLTNPGLIVTYKPQFIQSLHRVIKFKFNIQYDNIENLNSDSLTIVLGSRFNKSHLTAIDKMRSGDILSIEYVEVIHPSSKVNRWYTPNLVFRIE